MPEFFRNASNVNIPKGTFNDVTGSQHNNNNIIAGNQYNVFHDYRHEKESEAHQTANLDEGIEHPGLTDVIYCSDRAMANGFDSASSHEWANLGQGAPEVGPLPGVPPRPTSIPFPEDSLEYAPTTGVKALRSAVANLYNNTYRMGKESQYTYENVCIVPGRHAGLSRVAAVIGDGYCSYQVPDYTAYDQVLSAFRRLVLVPTALKQENKYRLDVEQLRDDINTQGLAGIIASNPRNPTGQVIKGRDLQELVALSRDSTTIIFDEFYSWYIYPESPYDFGESVSSAAYVEDVDQDSVIIIDGLTKNWRLPSWPVCWVIGPKNVITALSQSGSFLNGGANHLMQLAAISLVEPSRVAIEKVALQKHFKAKRDHALKRLKEFHLEVDIPPDGTFYIWLNLEQLPPPFNSGLTFFEELLKEQTIVIPGIFFNINPTHGRDLSNSPCHYFVRLSFGLPLADLDKGLDAIGRVLEKVRESMKAKQSMKGFGHSFKQSVDSRLSKGERYLRS